MKLDITRKWHIIFNLIEETDLIKSRVLTRRLNKHSKIKSNVTRWQHQIIGAMLYSILLGSMLNKNNATRWQHHKIKGHGQNTTNRSIHINHNFIYNFNQYAMLVIICRVFYLTWKIQHLLSSEFLTPRRSYKNILNKVGNDAMR